MMRRTMIFGAIALLGVGSGLLGCSDDDNGTKEQCGNGVLEGQEACDGQSLGQKTCQSEGFSGGTLACAEDCTLDTSGCTGSDKCGNGEVDTGEECDGSDLNGKDCSSAGFSGGTLGCAADCTLDVGGCTGGCGNGTLETGEACDGADVGNATCADQGFSGGTLGCAADCTLDVSGCTGGCGNGVKEAGEDCDGADLADQTCADLHYDSGTLTCGDDCTFDVSQCMSTQSALGGPCAANDGCQSGQCVPEVSQPQGDQYGTGLPGGTCIDACQQDGSCTDPNGICVSAGMSQFCAMACDPTANPSGCRDGYKCIDLGNGSGACWAGCTSNDQCETTGLCDVTGSTADATGFCLTPPEDCSDTLDNDFDGRTDCGDMDCNKSDSCPSGEICDNNVDDDSDGLTDCEDGECLTAIACTNISCTPAAALACSDALTDESNDQAGSTDKVDNWCTPGADGPWTGREYTYHFSVDTNTLVTVTATGLTGDLDMLVLRDDGTMGCNPVFCYAYSMNIQPDQGDSEDVHFEANPGYTYYIALDGYQDATSLFDLAVACEPGEVCNNGVDDDGDGLVDCDDPSCFGQTSCTSEANCGDGQDNDADGSTDCADSDCSADAYCLATSVFTEGFSTWPPTGWTIIDGSDDGNTWEQCDPANGCGSTLAGADGAFAIVDSDAAGQNVTMDEGLVSPTMNLATYAHVWLALDQEFDNLSTDDASDFAYIDVSTNGSTWTNVATYGKDTAGHVLIDVSTQLHNQANAQIRFRYVDGGEWAWHWFIDSIEVRAGN